MEKIIFFGDSFTYGDGLPDCMGGGERGLGEGPKPSKLGWANLLCEMRGASGRNLSKSGSSNIEILWNMLHTEIEPDEIIIVQWSFWNRDCLLDDPVTTILPNHVDRPPVIPYYKLHSNSDMINRNWLNINHGLLWLKQKPNHFFMFSNERAYTGTRFRAYCESDKNKIKLTDEMSSHYFNDLHWLDMADDDDHAGPKTNARWAETVNKILDSKLKN